MKILVTGSCGFIGFHVCEKLLLNGHDVIGIDNHNSYIYSNSYKESNLKILTKYKSYKEIRSDLLDGNYILDNEPDVVIHLAAHANVKKSIEDPEKYIRNNVECTCKILNELKQLKTKPLFVYASSSSVYGTNKKVPFEETDSLNNIISPYAISKKMCEDLVQFFCNTNKLKSIGFRFFTVYGPGGRPDMAIFNFLCKIKKNEPVTIYGDGSMKRDFTYVSDIVDGIYNSIFLELKLGEHRIYNLGNNNPTSLKELIKMCENVVGKQAIIINSNIPIGDVPITYANIEKARQELGYIPKVELVEGLKIVYKWISDLNIINS